MYSYRGFFLCAVLEMEDMMLREKIAVDIDGILNMIPSELLREGEIYFGKTPIFTGSVQDYCMCKLFGVTAEDEAGFWEKHLERLLRDSKVQTYAADEIRSLREEGVEIILLANWKPEFLGQPKLQRLTVEWLAENKIPYDELVFRQDKVAFCKEQGIRIAVEDSPTLLTEYRKEGIRTVGLLWYYNKYMQDIRLMQTWADLGCIIREWLASPSDGICEVPLSYREILKKYRVTTAKTVWNPQMQKSVPIQEKDYDVILWRVGRGYACEIYEVVKNAPGLDEKSLALICDDGNLCFGYDVRNGKIVVYTD